MEEKTSIESGVPPHPLGIKPLGNAYESKVDLKAFCGSFARLPDELLLQLFECLDARDLKIIGATCKTLYAFSRAEELWKPLFIECVHLSLENDTIQCSSTVVHMTEHCLPSDHHPRTSAGAARGVLHIFPFHLPKSAASRVPACTRTLCIGHSFAPTRLLSNTPRIYHQEIRLLACLTLQQRVSIGTGLTSLLSLRNQ